MKILVASSDLTPLLAADAPNEAAAVLNLPLALQRAGHEVSVAGPLLPAVEKSGAFKIKTTGVQISVPLGHERVTVQVCEARTADGLQTFLFRHEEKFGRLPDPAPGAAHMDAPAAVLFSKLLVELARRLNPAPDILQIQDWPGALAPLLLKTAHLPFTSVLHVGDPAAQGSFPIEDFHLLNLGWEHFRPTGIEFYGRLNFLKSGLVAASALAADGELERGALQTAEHGGGLDAVLRENADRLHGIPEGLDERTWNPAKDPFLAKRYQPSNLSGKLASRNLLLAQLGLGKNPAGPVFLLDLAAAQDRALLELLAGQLDQLLAVDARFVVLGRLPAHLPAAVAFEIAARKHTARFALVRDPNEKLRHLALAGADFQLLLGSDLHSTQAFLHGLIYGTLPIARAHLALRQIAGDYQPGIESGYGLVFYQSTREALFDTLAHRAPALLESPEHWGVPAPARDDSRRKIHLGPDGSRVHRPLQPAPAMNAMSAFQKIWNPAKEGKRAKAATGVPKRRRQHARPTK